MGHKKTRGLCGDPARYSRKLNTQTQKKRGVIWIKNIKMKQKNQIQKIEDMVDRGINTLSQKKYCWEKTQPV